MSSASVEVNLKQTLRKTEFPLCAKEALHKIEELICGRITSIKNMDLALDLMSEFIFCEIDRRGNKRTSPISALSELRLLQILFEYFNNVSNESTRNTVFLSLFSGSTAQQRSFILNKLVSLAIGIPSPGLLMSASTWMQQLGNSSTNSRKLAEAIVHDYFLLVPSAVERLTPLSEMAPEFTANFLTAVTENYYTSTKKNQIFPPKNLLETITSWLSKNSLLYVAAQRKLLLLPPGAIAMEASTPLAGLIRWCTLAPLFNEDNTLYCHLHLAVLNSILDVPKNSGSHSPKTIYAQHLSVPMRYILLSSNSSLEKHVEQNNLQFALDRYAQAVQVALSVNCIYGKIDQFLNQLQQLPYNKLMNIVIRTHN